MKRWRKEEIQQRRRRQGLQPTVAHRWNFSAIDLFFRYLADYHKDHAFCVLMFSTGTVGAVGLSRIKEQGGVTLAQAPDVAQYDSIPRAVQAN